MLYNKERAIQVMEKYGVDALVATLPENVYYFTGFAAWMNRTYKEWQNMPGASTRRGQTYAVFSKERPDNPVLVTRSPAAYTAQNPGWVDLEDIYTFGTFELDGYEPQRPEESRVAKIVEEIGRAHV
jgi:Xaa-Pro aminopeptidase